MEHLADLGMLLKHLCVPPQATPWSVHDCKHREAFLVRADYVETVWLWKGESFKQDHSLRLYMVLAFSPGAS